MVTLSVTRSRVAAVLHRAANLLELEGWDPERTPAISAIDRAAGFVRPGIDLAAEETTLQAWAALTAHLGEEQVDLWESTTGRTQDEVLAALRGAATAVTS